MGNTDSNTSSDEDINNLETISEELLNKENSKKNEEIMSKDPDVTHRFSECDDFRICFKTHDNPQGLCDQAKKTFAGAKCTITNIPPDEVCVNISWDHNKN